MTGDLDGRVIRGIDLNNSVFVARWNSLPANVQAEAKATIRGLVFLPLEQIPAKLHFHQLTNKLVPSALDGKKKVNSWSLHITADDRYKASFTYEDGTLYFRTCGLHDKVDKSP